MTTIFVDDHILIATPRPPVDAVPIVCRASPGRPRHARRRNTGVTFDQTAGNSGRKHRPPARTGSATAAGTVTLGGNPDAPMRSAASPATPCVRARLCQGEALWWHAFGIVEPVPAVADVELYVVHEQGDVAAVATKPSARSMRSTTDNGLAICSVRRQRTLSTPCTAAPDRPARS
jgi:hypothetical protein